MPTLSDIASMRETPRNKTMGYLSDFLNYLDQNALQKQFGYRNPVTGVISEALGIPAAARVANKLSYGEPITNVGKANVPLIPEDTAEAAMFTAPIAGKYLKTAGKMAGEAINNAMVYGEGNLAKITPQPMRMFVGPNSATFDKVNAVRAHEMERAGVDPEKIWQETGTFRGPDKQWRQEISDVGSKITDDVYHGIKEKQSFTGPASQALTHEELYKAYPELANIESGLYASQRPSGTYDASTKTITASGPGTTSQKSAMLHELQHAIQQKEGFARGGSASSIAPDIAQAKYDLKEIERQMSHLHDKASDEARYYIAKAKEEPEYKKFVDEAFAKYKAQLGEKSDKNPFGVDLNDAVKFHIIEKNGLVNKLGTQAENLRKLAGLEPVEAYRNLAGEAESRATQARMKMTEEERRKIFPLNSYDVPIKNLIVKYRD